MPDVQVLGGSGSIALDAAVFGVPFNGPLVHEVVVAELAARRRGTHSTRNRALVSGGTSKPWRQKGTGRARQGSIRSPQFAGGGTVFGPSPRLYTVKVNRKARRAALRCALSIHAERGSVFGLDAAGFDVPPETMPRVFVACVPRRRAASSATTTSCTSGPLNGAPKTSSSSVSRPP